MISKERYKIPSWCLSYLINADVSGLSVEDLKLVAEFEKSVIEAHGSGHWSVISDESYFSWTNDVSVLGSDIYECDYVVIDDEKLVTHTWLPVFPGFYGTVFDNNNIDEYELEYIREEYKPEELAETMIKHVYESKAIDKYYREYEQSTAKQCVNVIWNELRNLHYVEQIDFEELVSPREYNFANDSINVKVTFSDENIRNIKTMIQEHQDEWKEYLKNNYTSYDGFMSHHSNSSDSEEWDIDTALADSHNAGAILNFLCIENNITEDTLYYGCESCTQLDIDMLKKECIEKGWYVPTNICLDWIKSLYYNFRNNYRFRKVKSFSSVPMQYIFDTPKQRYIFTNYKGEFPTESPFVYKRFFGRFVFAKLKEEKKDEDNN